MITANNKAANIDANDAIAVSSTMKCAEQFERRFSILFPEFAPSPLVVDEERA